MISCQITGGIGNQLFQIFTTIATSKRLNLRFQFNRNKRDSYHRPSYWYLFEGLSSYITCDTFKDYRIYKEPFFHYLPIPIVNNNIILSGYFQSYKYFDKEFNHIFSMTGLEKKQHDCIAKYKENFPYKNSVSLHFRLGDYVGKSDYHPILTDKYYISALQKIQKKTENINHVICFFEKENKDQICKRIKIYEKKFPELKFILIPHDIQDWEQLFIMSACTHNIIANSSFSWWAAYINKNKNKNIIYPSKWFGKIANINTKDLCPSSWLCLQV